MTLVAIHQPDLLPYTGFWFKMAVSDCFVLARHDQFQKHGYQRRVAMRESWVSHQLVGKPSMVPITEVEVVPGWQDRLIAAIRGRYTGARYWSTRGQVLLEGISAARGSSLADVNESLIHLVREQLSITTPLAVTDPPSAAGLARLVEQVRAVGGDAYLSGPGGESYLGVEASAAFSSQGIRLVWSDHQPDTSDSIVSVLMSADEPMESVLRRRPPNDPGTQRV